MARKSVRSLLLTALLATPLLSYATQYPLTVTDLDGRQVTLAKEPQRIILQDGRDIMTLALLDRDNPFKRLVAWNNLAKKQDVATWQGIGSCCAAQQPGCGRKDNKKGRFRDLYSDR